MLTLKSLHVDFILAQRIVAARSVEVADVARVRFLKHGLSHAQRSFTNRRELHVAVAAIGKGVFGDDTCRGGGRWYARTDRAQQKDGG